MDLYKYDSTIWSQIEHMNKNQKCASLRNTSKNSSPQIVVDFHTNIYLWASYKYKCNQKLI